MLLQHKCTGGCVTCAWGQTQAMHVELDGKQKCTAQLRNYYVSNINYPLENEWSLNLDMALILIKINLSLIY